MSQEVVDNKVVELKFDNQQFEKGVKESISTIDKLKSNLNFSGASKSFNRITEAANNVSFKGLEKNIDGLSDYVSVKAMAMFTVVNNIVTQIQSSISNMMRQFTIVPISTGFDEYELKMGSVQTIMAATGEELETVNKYLEELNEYSDKTIYSFSDMTTNIGKFTNAGVKLEDAVLAMKGISNEAAVSGANANEASRAMYNLAQSLSMGYVQYIDWKSIENANMATVEFKTNLAKMAEQIGTVTKTTDGYYNVAGKTYNLQQLFKDGMKEQWLTTDVLIGTLRNYADETTEIGKKAYAAAQDVKTFTMMMDTLKEAAQSGWAYTWEIFVGDFNEAKKLFTDFSQIFGKMIDDAADARNTLLRSVLGSKWDQLTAQINAAGISTETFHQRLANVLREDGVPIDELIKRWGSLEEALKHVGDIKDKVIKVIQSFTAPAIEAGDAITGVTGKLEDFQKVVRQVIRGEFGSGKERVKKLTEAGKEYAVVQGLVNKIWERNGHNWKDTSIAMDDLVDVMKKLGKTELDQMGITEEQIKALEELQEQAVLSGSDLNELLGNLNKKTGRELIFESIRNSVIAVTKVLGVLKEAWVEVFPPKTSEHFYNIIAAFHRFTESLILNDDRADKLKRTFKGLFSIVGIFGDIIKTIAKIFFPMFAKGSGKMGDGILSITAVIGDCIVAFREFLQTGGIVGEVLLYLKDMFVAGVKTIGEFVSSFKNLPFVKNIINKIANSVKSMIDKVTELFSNLRRNMTDDNKTLTDILFETWSKINDKLKDIGQNLPTIKKIRETFKKMFTDFKESGKNVVEGFIEGLDKAVKDLPKKVTEFAEVIVNTFKEYMGIESPSKLFFKLAEYCVAGFVEGIMSNYDKTKETIDKWGELISNNLLKQKVMDKITDTKDKFKGVLDKIVNALKEFKDKMIPILETLQENLKDKDFVDKLIGIAIKLLVALLLFKRIKTLFSIAEGIENFGEGVLKIGQAFKKMAGGIKDYFKSLSLKNYTKIVRSFMTQIMLFMGVIWLMTKTMDDDEVARAKEIAILIGDVMVVFGVIAAVLTASYAAIDKFLGSASGLDKVILSMALLMVAIGGAVWLICDAMEKLKGMSKKTDTYRAAEEFVLKLMGGLMAFGLAMSAIGIFASGSLLGAAASILAVGLALRIVVDTIEKYFYDKDGVFDSSKATQITDAFKSLVWIIGAITASIAIMGMFVKGSGLLGAAAAILALSGAIILIVGAAWVMDKAIGDMKHPIASLIAVGVLIVALGAVAGLTGELLQATKATALLGAAGLILAFSWAIMTISDAIKNLKGVEISNSAGVTMIVSIIGFIVVFGIAVAALLAMGQEKTKNATGVLLGMSAMLLALAGSIYIITKLIKDYDMEKVLTASGILLALVLALAALALASGKLMSGASGWSALNILAIAIGVGALAGSLFLLKDVDADHIMQVAFAMTAVIAALMVVSHFFAVGWQSAAVIVAIGAAMWIVGDALKRISDVPFDVMLQGLANLIGVIIAVGLAMIAFLAIASAFGPVLLPAAVIVLAVAAAIWLVTDAFVALIEHKDEIARFWNSVCEAIKKVIDKIGEAIRAVWDFIREFTTLRGILPDEGFTPQIPEEFMNEYSKQEQKEYDQLRSYLLDPPDNYDYKYSQGFGEEVKRQAQNEVKVGVLHREDFENKGKEDGEAYVDGMEEGVDKGGNPFANFMSYISDYTKEIKADANYDLSDISKMFGSNLSDAFQNTGIMENSHMQDFMKLMGGDMGSLFGESTTDGWGEALASGDFTGMVQQWMNGIGTDENLDSAYDLGSLFGDSTMQGYFDSLTKGISSEEYIPKILSDGTIEYYDANGNKVSPDMSSLLSGFSTSGLTQTVNFPDTMNTTSPDVVQAVNALKQDIYNLGERISNLYVRLDTGTIAGAVTPYVNKSMGQFAQYKTRGN